MVDGFLDALIFEFKAARRDAKFFDEIVETSSKKSRISRRIINYLFDRWR
jgi:hypothetical protein